MKLANARVEGNELIIGTIDIGDDAYIGTSVVIEEDVRIGANAQVEDLTSVASGARVPDLAIYDGSPGRITGTCRSGDVPRAAAGLAAAQRR